MAQRCFAWDSEAAWQLGCISGLWLVDGDVWDQAETLDVTMDGSLPPTAMRRCKEPVVAACHVMAGFTRFALPRNSANGLRFTILPREGQDLASLDTVLQGYGLRIRCALSDGADRRQRWPLGPGAAAAAPAGGT